MRQVLLITLIALPLLLRGQSTMPVAIATSDSLPSGKIENALLWEVSGKGLAQPSHVFGTIHLIGKEDFFLPENLKPAFAKAEKIVFEINTDEMFDLSTQISLLFNSFMDGNVRLRDLLSSEDYALVKGHFDNLGLPMMLIDRIKPMILSVLASEDLSSGGMRSGSTMSYELELTDMARQARKPIDGLETVDFQMSMFDSIPYQAQARMLVDAIRGAGNEGGDFDQLVELYKNQDLQGMEAAIKSDTVGIGEYDQLLLVQRNRNWIPIMAKMMATQPSFFAVGAAHLAGQQGVINLLRQEGYTLKPLSQ